MEVIDEWRDPPLADVVEEVEQSRAEGRGAALHCTSPAEVVLDVTALQVACGPADRDRLEHAGVPAARPGAALAAMGVTVWVRARTRRRLATGRSLLRTGVRVALGSDAPFGPLDPWAAVAAARDRRSAGGAVLGTTERVPAAVALHLLLGELGRPGGPAQQVVPGAPADLCLFNTALEGVLADPQAERVRAMLVAGAVLQDAL